MALNKVQTEKYVARLKNLPWQSACRYPWQYSAKDIGKHL